ncbi:MAG: DUF86 domain-containing protein [Acidobacteria bacterium]|nr:DUF86 domain-containing protein [Acidobacteriota bacterium]
MRSDEAYLLDMLIAARDAQAFTSGVTREQLEASRLHQLALLKALETIGEAAARISESFRAGHPEIPWREIVGMRNRLVHSYFEVDLDEVWDTLQNDLPALIAAIGPLVPPEEP